MATTLLMPLPAAGQEIRCADTMRTGMTKTVRTAKIALGTFGVGVFGMAAVVPMGSAVVGSGEVQAESLVKEITHPNGGVVSSVLVHEGDHVKKGDVLIRFDTTVSGASAQYSAMSVTQLLAAKARLEAVQRGDGTITFPDELTKSDDPAASEAMAEAQRQFDVDREKNASMRGQLQERIAQHQQQIISDQRQAAALREQYDLIVPEREGLRQLWKKKLVSINRLNQMERTAVELKGQSSSLAAQVAQGRAQIGEVRQQIANHDQTVRSEAGSQLMTVNSQLNDQRVRAASASDTYDRSAVRAPYGGVVDKLSFTTVGSFVPPSQQIVDIVPDNDLMEVSVQISPMDIDQIHVGQPARVRFAAFNTATTPEIRGKVAFVSAERTQDQRTGASYYRARVSLAHEQLEKHGAMQLKTGMPAEVFVETGSRTMLSYLTKPLRDQFQRAFLQD